MSTHDDVVYLDHAAATPLDPAVLKAMQPYLTERFYNPSATYKEAQAVHADLESARAGVAHWLGAKPTEIIFTAGGTEANNLAIRGVMEQFPEGNVVVSSIEHESVLAAAGACKHSMAPVTPEGIVDVAQLEKLLDDATVLISVMYANNEVGTVQPIRRITQLAEAIRQKRAKSGNKLPLYVHTDAAQAAGFLDLHAARLGVDMLTINAGKIYGPRQVGALYVQSHVILAPQMLGGGQERGLRSGTENVAGAVGMRVALDIAQEPRQREAKRLQDLQAYFITQLQQALASVRINGSRKLRLPNNVHVTIPGIDNERVIFQLDDRGVICAAGSACSADSGEPSHVLRAMGLSDDDARASLRFTMGRDTTKKDIDHTVQALVSSIVP
ncbi:MAG TPA: cysteine desulfurase family protein [Candidatus Saccharimonadales bacterium]|nr:cysteine desulfurase family protein [Candidatus Saccharimonadales bacterium]